MGLHLNQGMLILQSGKLLISTSTLVFLLTLLASRVVFCADSDEAVNERLTRCIKAPDVVQIDCRVLNVKNGSCVENNVISVPRVEENRLGVINCTSPRPIDISFVGFKLNDFVKTSYVRNAENVFNEATYVFTVSITLAQIEAPREVVVRSHLNVDHQTSFFVFRPGTSVFSSNLRPRTINRKNDMDSISIPFLERNLVLPCVPNDPNVVPTLDPFHDGQVEFVKTRGFIISTDGDEKDLDRTGKYSCRANGTTGDKEEHVSFTVLSKSDIIFEPSDENIYAFSNSELKISCKYGQRVRLTGIFQDKPISPKSIVSDTSLLQYESQFVEKYFQPGDTGTVECRASDNDTVLKEWKIQVLDIRNNSILSLNKDPSSEEQVVCQSSIVPINQMKLQVVFCRGERECKLNEFCFDENMNGRADCEQTVTGQACKQNVDPQQGLNSLCLTLPQHNMSTIQGTIRCSAGNYSYQTNYFRGFDKKLYLDWHEAPLSALIEISVPTNVTMYPHNSYPFGCKAVSFISDGKLQWVIRGKDGSEILLHKNRVQDINNYYATQRDYELYTVRESNIRLIYPNDYDVICWVPKWNETGWVRHHRRINVAAKEAPVWEIVTGAAVVILILIGVVIFVMWRLKQAKDAIRNLTEKEVQEFHEGNPEALKNAGDKDAHEVIDSLPYDQRFEIPREKLIIDSENILGKGAFGTVLKGRVEGLSDAVAVKTVNNDCEVSRFKGFLSELKIMIYIGKHPFIVSLIGASTEKIKEKTLYIVVEYCLNGSLESYMRKYKQYFINLVVGNEIKPNAPSYANAPEQSTSWDDIMTTVDLVRWSYQVANGMEYLANKKVVHADLAARNVLIDYKKNGKITDFGLSRQLFDYTQYVKKQQEPLPWRWMAIESLQQLRFSSHSDVWAYGVLIWEIFSIGDIPYPGLSWNINFVQELCDGLRLIKPPWCTEGIYNLMLDCWQEDPDSRPSFNHLSQYFKTVLETLDVELEVTREPPSQNNYTNANAFVPGYMLVSELANGETGSNAKTSNIYINS